MIDIEKVKSNIDNLSKTLTLNIDSIFLEENGKVDKVFYKNEDLHELRSCAKILVAMAVGIAIDKKMKIDGEDLTLDTLIYPTIKNLIKLENKANIEKIKQWNIRTLLTHTTGYESQMMSEKYIENIDKDKLLEYALNYNIPYEPGTRFAYNNVEPFVLSVFFQEAFNINLCAFIKNEIFNKIDILEYKWENYGKYCPGATGLYMKHSDFHKLGQLLLNNGKYNNIQVVPEKWIKEMCKMQLETPSAYKSERVFPKMGVGYYLFIYIK